MKKLLTTICLMFTPLFASGGTAFEDDPTNYFVSGSGANEALSMVNEIICFLKNTRSERYVNDGYYKATVYVDDCSTVSAASSSADGAKPKKSGASDGDKKGTTAEQKTGSTAILNVTRGDGEGDPQRHDSGQPEADLGSQHEVLAGFPECYAELYPGGRRGRKRGPPCNRVEPRRARAHTSRPDVDLGSAR